MAKQPAASSNPAATDPLEKALDPTRINPPKATNWKLEDYIITKPMSYIIGFVVSFLLTELIVFIIGMYTEVETLEWLLTLVIVTASLMLPSINYREIPTTHVGLILLFGGRLKLKRKIKIGEGEQDKEVGVVLSEGRPWLPRPKWLFDIQLIGVMEKRMVVPPPTGGHPFTIETVKYPRNESGQPLKDNSGNYLMEYVIAESKLLITGRVLNTISYTDAGGATGQTTPDAESAVEKNVVATTNDALRSIAGSGMFNDLDINNRKGEIANTMRDAVNHVAVNEWGFGVETVKITSFLPDPKTREVRQATAREQAQRQSEEIEANAKIARIKSYSQELGISASEAADRDEAERGKAERDQIVISRSHNGPQPQGGSPDQSGETNLGGELVDAAALLKNAMGQNPNNQKPAPDQGKKKPK